MSNSSRRKSVEALLPRGGCAGRLRVLAGGRPGPAALAGRADARGLLLLAELSEETQCNRDRRTLSGGRGNRPAEGKLWLRSDGAARARPTVRNRPESFEEQTTT